MAACSFFLGIHFLDFLSEQTILHSRFAVGRVGNQRFHCKACLWDYCTFLNLGIEVLCVSALSFVGIGITPPTPEWGALLSAGKQYLSTAPYLCLYPGVMIMLSVLGFNLLGDGLRDALDPRLK